MMCRKLTMLPIECIVRGYITGSGWASYQENGTVCGIKLPECVKESDKLPEPIYTCLLYTSNNCPLIQKIRHLFFSYLDPGPLLADTHPEIRKSHL